MNSFPDAEGCRQANAEAKFSPASSVNPEEGYPCIEVEGVQVYVYLCPKRQVLRISAHFDGVPDDSPILDECGNVPVEVDLGGTVVWRGPERG